MSDENPPEAARRMDHASINYWTAHFPGGVVHLTVETPGPLSEKDAEMVGFLVQYIEHLAGQSAELVGVDQP